MLIFFKYIIYFMIYACLGWLCEVVYCSIINKKFINRGFLILPICPIYGFGGLFVILLLNWLKQYTLGFLYIGLLGCVITTIVEYLTSYIMEKIFKMRWWDYSNKKYNINGRVCLLNSILFMILSLVIIYVIHPIINIYVSSLNSSWIYVIGSISFVCVICDTIYSSIQVTDFVNKIEDIISNKVFDFKERYHKFEYKLKKFINRFPTMKLNKTSVKEWFSKIKKSR